MYAKILVPLDTNQKESYWLKEPLKTALMISQIPERPIYLMSARPYHLLESYYPNIHRHEIAEETKSKLGSIAEQCCPRGTAVEVCVEEGGSISSDILKIARERSVDAIVMASHMPVIKDYLFGSHASNIALHAPCAVFVVRNR